MAFPATIDNPDTTMQGGSFVATNDHALDHRTLGSAVIAVETYLGTNAGTNIAMNFVAGNFPARINSSNVLQQTLTGTLNNNGQGTNTGTTANGVYGTATYQGGTGNGMVLGTPTIGTITVPGTVNALSFSAAIAPGVGTIVDSAGGTFVVNAQQGQIFYSVQGTTAGNRTVGTPQNPTAYQQLTYAFKTSGSANGTLVWTPIFRISQDSGTPTLGTGTSWNYYNWRYNAVDTKYDFLGQVLDLV